MTSFNEGFVHFCETWECHGLLSSFILTSLFPTSCPEHLLALETGRRIDARMDQESDRESDQESTDLELFSLRDLSFSPFFHNYHPLLSLSPPPPNQERFSVLN